MLWLSFFARDVGVALLEEFSTDDEEFCELLELESSSDGLELSANETRTFTVGEHVLSYHSNLALPIHQCNEHPQI